LANKIEALTLVLQKLQFDSKTIKESFQKRFQIQKYIYLLQEWKGYNWRYGYNVYMSAPYSPSLTKDVYQIISTGLINNTEGELDETFIKDLNAVKDLATDDEQLEALTTLFYIAKSFIWATKDPQKLEDFAKSRFQTVKPFISKDVRDCAWKIISEKKMLGKWTSSKRYGDHRD